MKYAKLKNEWKKKSLVESKIQVGFESRTLR